MRIKELRKSLKGWTQADLAEATGLSQSYIGAIESRNIEKSPSTDTLISIANVLGVRVGDLFDDAKPIPIVGRASPGAKISFFGDDAEVPRIACPSELSNNDNIAGIEVLGDAMLPIYRDGDVLFYIQNYAGISEKAVGSICICEDACGGVWVRYVKSGSEPGKFHLITINPLGENVFDVQLKWASPVKLHWPRELVEVL